VDAFAEKDLSEEVAIENARLAKILTANDYDFINKQPVLWTPTSDYRLDD
jgi:DNA polymerase-1